MSSLNVFSGMLVVCLFLGGGVAQQPQPKRMDEWEALNLSLKEAQSMRPRNGFVPDEITAVRIGEAVAIAQYGEKGSPRSGLSALDFMARPGL